MRRINKGNEPPSLLVHRKQKNSNYDNIPKQAKKDLRKSLLKEQGYICCYCMQRIDEKNSKIEHYKPQKYEHLQLDYHNLLASCKGNEGKNENEQHCDTHKGKREINISPVDKNNNCENFIKYRNNGTIYSDDPNTNNDLKDVLNLNVEILKKNRSSILDQVILEITRVKGRQAAWPLPFVRKVLAKYENSYNGKYIPYCQVVITFLKKRFANEL